MLFSKAATPRQLDFALLALRVSSGLTMAAHGYQKVFTYGVAGVAGGFSGLGIPQAPVAAVFISYLELVGGVLVAVGILTRPLALLLMMDMLVASIFVHLKEGFFLPRGAEFTLLLMAIYLALVFTGAGSFSLDAIVGRNRKST